MNAILGYLVKGATTLGGAGLAVTLGEAVAKRTGIMRPETSIVVEGVEFLCDVIGVPQPNNNEPPAPPQLAGPSTQKVCGSCGPRTITVSGAGEIEIGLCESCEAIVVENATDIEAMYDGWAESYGVAVDAEGLDVGSVKDCGSKPRKSDKRFNDGSHFKAETFYHSLSNWQKCVAREKNETQKEAKQKNKEIKAAKDKTAKAQRKVAAHALENQKQKYEAQIAEMQKAQADAKSAEEKQQYQQQIDRLNAEALNTTRLQAEMASKASDAATQAKIDKLQETIANNAAKPGGMDSMMSKMLEMQIMKAMMAPPPTAPDAMAEMMKMKAMASMIQPPPAAPPQQFAPPMQQLQPPPMFAAPQFAPPFDPGLIPQPMYDDSMGMPGYYYAGADASAPLDPDVAEAFGLSGIDGLTVGDANFLSAVRDVGDIDFAALVTDIGRADDDDAKMPGNCAKGSCGL